MADALGAAGVRDIPHRMSQSPDDLLAAWQWGCPSVVVKPPASSGSEDVRPCTTAQQIVAAAQRIIGKVNACEQLNPAAMIQPYVQGDEFVVDAVSADRIALRDQCVVVPEGTRPAAHTARRLLI